MTAPDVTQLRDAVEQHFRDDARTYGLNRTSLTVTYVLNWGGFVNHSFRVSDGRTQFHLKLATSDAARAALHRWHDLDSMLQSYNAPPVLGWIDVEGAGGLLFPVVAGESPRLTAEVVEQVSGALGRLWQDEALAAALPRTADTAADYYFRTYDERFGEDLRSIRSAKPPFLTIETVDYLDEQAGRLGDRVRAAAAFQETLTTPVHGDLWLDNVLWENARAWHLLDWDDLAIGDPAADIAMLTGPNARDLRPLERVDEIRTPLSRAIRERLTLLGQASLLDWAIDPLADWVDADRVPAHEHEVRREKESVHREALALYRELYEGQS